MYTKIIIIFRLFSYNFLLVAILFPFAFDIVFGLQFRDLFGEREKYAQHNGFSQEFPSNYLIGMLRRRTRALESTDDWSLSSETLRSIQLWKYETEIVVYPSLSFLYEAATI